MSASGLDYADFDRYCDDHGIKPGEEPAAFAAWLHEISDGAWDGPMERVDAEPELLNGATPAEDYRDEKWRDATT